MPSKKLKTTENNGGCCTSPGSKVRTSLLKVQVLRFCGKTFEWSKVRCLSRLDSSPTRYLDIITYSFKLEIIRPYLTLSGQHNAEVDLRRFFGHIQDHFILFPVVRALDGFPHDVGG